MSITDEMRFKKYGQAYHLQIRHAADLAQVPHLKNEHWVATGVPVNSIHADPVLEAYLDTDGNERIMCFELSEAITWLLTQLNDVTGIDEASTTLSLDALDLEQEEARHIQEAAERILLQLGKPDHPTISLDDVRTIKQKVEATPISETGTVLPSAATDEKSAALIEDIIETLGGVDHPSEEKGVNQEQLDTFLTQAQAWLDWNAKAAGSDRNDSASIMPLGTDTPEAMKAYAAIKDKIDQYFAQCDAVTLSPLAGDFIKPTETRLKTVDLSDPAAIKALLAEAPIAPPRPDHVLHLNDGVNPHYVEPLEGLRLHVLTPLLERTPQTLSDFEWDLIKARMKPHEAWLAENPGKAIETLGQTKLATYLDPAYREAVEALIAQNRTTAVEMNSIRRVEKLILYQAHMLMLVNNVVSFPFLYEPHERAVFEMGSLIIDGRELRFSVKVDHRAEHAAIAKTSNIFTLYVQVMPGHGRDPYEVAVPVTAGGKGNLCVGKRGLFRELDGFEADAKVVQIIENPISLGETLVAPVQRLGKLLTGKIEAMTTSAEKKLDSAAVTLTEPAAAQKPAAPNNAMAGGLLMGGGVAIAALGSSVAFITKTLHDVAPIKIVAGILAAILAIIAPASIIALLKLRRRDLSAILEGAGWAINTRMRLTFRLGRFFTRTPKRPGRDCFSIS